ncbi:hypothetical protein BpHYR1_047890 [Brachionus plicatilis]|uniref:Uncharacterized protein n=1 Tax=Brachionus plicatilis TaxID=10195 RepID=A0A3M7T943_BRAPC|nr:hypothetical protein BpHYR1_047890 [Brachionus plicatilis]
MEKNQLILLQKKYIEKESYGNNIKALLGSFERNIGVFSDLNITVILKWGGNYSKSYYSVEKNVKKFDYM